MKRNKNLKNFTDEELLKEVVGRKLQNKNGFPDPIPAHCFKCQKQFWIKFVVPRKGYSKKNNWNYWCEEANKNLKICNFCLKNFYLTQRQEFLATVKSLKKRNNLIGYIRKNFV